MRRRAVQLVSPWSLCRSFNTTRQHGAFLGHFQWRYQSSTAGTNATLHQPTKHGDGQPNILQILESRGLVNQIAGERDGFERLLTAQPMVGVYMGIDPTAPSLHIGHLIPFMALLWMYNHGYNACCIVGGGTGLIGDPSGRTSARAKQEADQISKNTKAILASLRELVQNSDRAVESTGIRRATPRSVNILNNAQWLKTVTLIDLMGSLGTHLKIGPMLGRDSVKQRLKKGDSISLAEFCYPLFQARDWCQLYRDHRVRVQIGGSDQFGNILAGMDAVNYLRKNRPEDLVCNADKTDQTDFSDRVKQEPLGFTTPLLTTSSGAKFGKSEGNAIWLDRKLTRPFDFYQFFLSVADADVKYYLKLFTFLSLDEIDGIMDRHERDQSKRVAQHALAFAVTELVHGEHIAAYTEKNHRDLFSKSGEQDIPTDATSHGPSIPLPLSLVKSGLPFARLLYHTNMADSMSQARHVVRNNGAYAGRVADGKVKFETVAPTSESLVSLKEKVPVNWTPYIGQDHTMLIRKGKKTPRIIRLLKDEAFVNADLDFPGSARWWNEICEEQYRRPSAQGWEVSQQEEEIPEPASSEPKIP